jgi:multidrug efflux system outer membrane protein
VIRRTRAALLAACLVACGGCLMGPDYERPAVDQRGAFRGQRARGTASYGDVPWARVFRDPELQALLRVALARNLDVGIAAARVLQAEAQLDITRGDQLPTIGIAASAERQRYPASGGLPAGRETTYRAVGTASWQLDFWGKYRRASEAARADLLAAGWARRAVVTTLVADLASAYFQLRELDLELVISRRTLASRKKSLELVALQEKQGTVSLLDVRRAEQLVHGAGLTSLDLERRIARQENLVRLLVGANPGPVERGRALVDQPHDSQVPAGLPSSLLQRRADIRAAEQGLVAANARIGVARAAYFPDIALTASGGAQSSALSSLLDAPARLWSAAAALSGALFDGGRERAGVRLSEAQRQEALLVYRQTILQAFREVSDALVAHRVSGEFRSQQELLTEAARDAARLSDQRYRGGTASYLEVLDSESRHFAAQLDLAQARLGELLALVQLYRALGGGWRG